MPDSPKDDDELDELLGRARWPEPSAASTERLRRRYVSLRSPRSLWWPIAAAAAVLITIGSATWFGMQSGVSRPAAVVLAPETLIEQPSGGSTGFPSRAATLHEQLVLRSASPPSQSSRPTTRPAQEIDHVMRMAIHTAADGKLADAAALLKPFTRREIEAALTNIAVREADVSQRRAAIGLLAHVGGNESLRLLVRLANDPAYAEAAMPGVSRLGGVSALKNLARNGSEATRREGARCLLARADEAGTDAFLSLVLDSATRTSALSALHDAPKPAVPSLLAALDHRRVECRLAAARSLGSICDHGMLGARLQQMVQANQNRREALAALVSCPGKPAADFLRKARNRPAIDVQIRAVKSELASIFPESNTFQRRS